MGDVAYKREMDHCSGKVRTGSLTTDDRLYQTLKRVRHNQKHVDSFMKENIDGRVVAV